MKLDITIVMPVYNSAEYLKESIQGIMNQSFHDFELICVDDCSDDLHTLEILNNCASMDRRISVYHLKQNCGAAEARNFGLEKAKGKYIQFVDADDVFSENMLEEMYNAISEANADICVCSHKAFRDGNTEEGEVFRPRKVEGLTERPFSIHNAGEDGLCWWWDVPWNKLVRRNLIMGNNIRFQKLTSYNDGYYANMVVLLATKIVYTATNEPLVFYRTNISTQITAKNDIMNFYLFMKRVLDNRWSYGDSYEKAQLLYVLAESGLYWLKQPGEDSKKAELYQKISEELRKRYNSDLVSYISKGLLEHINHYLNYEFEKNWIG